MRALVAACLFSLAASAAHAEIIRIATYNTELSRDGPGLLLRDIQRGDDPAINAVVEVIARIDADILVLQGIDWDLQLRTLDALRDALKGAGAPYLHRFALRPNSGLASGHDLDGDGRLGGPGDAYGFGAFTGQGGIAILSRFPIHSDQALDYSALLWQDFPNALLPTYPDGAPFPSAEARAVQRLSSTGHWVVPIETPNGQLNILTFQAGPPVFDGPEDRNGKRNHDEIRLVSEILHQRFAPLPSGPVVIAGGANLDPWDSDGRGEAIRALLADLTLQDPAPESPGARVAPSEGHRTPDARDTVDWPNVGRLRVDYILPAATLEVGDAGVYWPVDDGDAATVQAASRHRPVWVDLKLD